MRLLLLVFCFTDTSALGVRSRNSKAPLRRSNKANLYPSNDDLIRSGTINELAKHGIRLNDVNDLLFGSEGGADPTETERVAAATPSPPPSSEELAVDVTASSTNAGSWLFNACEFVKHRHIVNLPSICLQRFPKYVSISSKQRRKCHKLQWDCVVATPVGQEKILCAKKHVQCMGKTMSDREIAEIFFSK